MPGDRTKNMRRLAQTADLLYKIEKKEMARIDAMSRELRERKAEMQAYLDANVVGAAPLTELAIASAVRLREKLVEVEAQYVRQMELTVGSMAKAQGAKIRLETAMVSVEKAAEERSLNELIEAIVVSKSA